MANLFDFFLERDKNKVRPADPTRDRVALTLPDNPPESSTVRDPSFFFRQPMGNDLPEQGGIMGTMSNRLTPPVARQLEPGYDERMPLGPPPSAAPDTPPNRLTPPG